MLKDLLFSLLAGVLFFNWEICAQKNYSLSGKTDFAKTPNSIGIENEELSAIVPIENGSFFLVADDKKPELTVISNETRQKAGSAKCPDKEPTCENFPKNNPKWEAMAKDGEYIYAAGAYRKAEDKDIEKIILRFKIRKSTKNEFEIFSVQKIIVDDPFKGIADNDPRIEGLAVKKTNDKIELAIGIRNIDVDNKTKPGADCKIRINKIDLTDAELKSQPLKTFPVKDFFSFNAGLSQKENFRFHLSSLEYIPQLNGFLIITSTEDTSNNFFGNALWFMSDDEIEKKTYNPVKVTVIESENPLKISGDFESDMKAEGLCLISVSRNEYRLAIAFDNDKSQTKRPSKLYFYYLTVTEPTKSS